VSESSGTKRGVIASANHCSNILALALQAPCFAGLTDLAGRTPEPPNERPPLPNASGSAGPGQASWLTRALQGRCTPQLATPVKPAGQQPPLCRLSMILPLTAT